MGEGGYHAMPCQATHFSHENIEFRQLPATDAVCTANPQVVAISPQRRGVAAPRLSLDRSWFQYRGRNHDSSK